MKQALLFARAACESQASSSSIAGQLDVLRKYAAEHGLSIAAEITSVRMSPHAPFDEIAKYLHEHADVRTVLTVGASRISRALSGMFSLHSLIDELDLEVHLVHEARILRKDTDNVQSQKSLATSICEAFDRFYSDSFSEKQRDRKRHAISSGRVPWLAGPGYINIRSKGGSNIKPDPDRAPLILQAFELIANQGLSKRAALQIVTQNGLTNRQGTRIHMRTFDRILKNPIYAGWVSLPSDQNFKPVRGLHEPIVPQELFDRVQKILFGK